MRALHFSNILTGSGVVLMKAVDVGNVFNCNFAIVQRHFIVQKAGSREKSSGYE